MQPLGAKPILMLEITDRGNAKLLINVAAANVVDVSRARAASRGRLTRRVAAGCRGGRSQ